MHRLSRIFGTLTLLAALVGCKKGEESIVRFTAEAYDWEKTQATLLPEGTEVGVLSQGNLLIPNAKTVVSGGELVSDNTFNWSAALDEDTPFYGYMPYDPSATGLPFTFSVREDQSTAEAYSASDFVGASALVSPGLQVRFLLKHRLCRFVVKVRGEAPDEAGTVQSVVFKQVARTGTMSVIARGFSEISNYGDVVALPGNGLYSALFFSGTYRLSFILKTASGKLYTCTLPSEMEFEAGKSYSTEMDISESHVVTGSDLAFTVTVTDWTDGGNLPF